MVQFAESEAPDSWDPRRSSPPDTPERLLGSSHSVRLLRLEHFTGSFFTAQLIRAPARNPSESCRQEVTAQARVTCSRVTWGVLGAQDRQPGLLGSPSAS